MDRLFRSTVRRATVWKKGLNLVKVRTTNILEEKKLWKLNSMSTIGDEDEGKCKKHIKRCIVWLSRQIAYSRCFAALTTILTFYALFGDDMRLLLTDRRADPIFDCVTLACMIIFGIEIVACSIGKAGYLFGFFFLLDILSTVTLVLDITIVAEFLFGDSVSHSSGPEESGASSTDAARAARLSRIGTKAGRVVRLLRLVRLLKIFRRGGAEKKYKEVRPSEHWQSDEEVAADVNESAVSKKLSDMTTRRVTLLVLSIMIWRPLFQVDMFKDPLTSSAQYGIDGLYRRFREDMVKFVPTAGPTQSQAYLASADRDNYARDFMLYIYFHNWFCKDIPADKADSPSTSFGKIFWLGGSPTNAAEAEFYLPGRVNQSSINWNQLWNRADWPLYLCDLPPEALTDLSTPWNETTKCLNGNIRGMSIITSEDPRAKCPEDLRYQERIVLSPMLMSREESKKFVFMYVFDRRPGSRMEAALNSAQTVFICILLGVGAMTFTKDANTLVLDPLERMISNLEKIRKNPFAALSLSEDETTKEQIKATMKNAAARQSVGYWGVRMLDLGHNLGHMAGNFGTRGLSRSVDTRKPQRRLSYFERFINILTCHTSDLEKTPEPMETVILERTIIKLGSLLALGFGEAGGEAIGQSMAASGTEMSSGAVNAMIPGKRVEAIFGFCDIRNFAEATEVLEDHVMVFVNRIACVVHTCVNEFLGSPSQNLGDAFLLVWCLSDYDSIKRRKLIDCSIVSFAKIIANISKSPMIAEYRTHSGLVKRYQNFRVRVGCGLHTGWAIEGAMGSGFKMDASYLSTNVNMSSRLQDLTRVYDTKIIISAMVVEMASKAICDLCRNIDTIAFDDSEHFELFAMDLDDMALDVDHTLRFPETRKEKLRQRFFVQALKKERWEDDFDVEEFVGQDEDIEVMRRNYTAEFFEKYSMALHSYQSGNWVDALSALEETRFSNVNEDGPSAALMNFMTSFPDYDGLCKAPPKWRGYRVYT